MKPPSLKLSPYKATRAKLEHALYVAPRLFRSCIFSQFSRIDFVYLYFLVMARVFKKGNKIQKRRRANSDQPHLILRSQAVSFLYFFAVLSDLEWVICKVYIIKNLSFYATVCFYIVFYLSFAIIINC